MNLMKKCLMMNLKLKKCANCGNEAIYYCCWNTSYCNEDCQKVHWSQHFKVCSRLNTDQQANNTESSSNEYEYSNENSRLDESDNYTNVSSNTHSNYSRVNGNGSGSKKRKNAHYAETAQSSPLASNGLMQSGPIDPTSSSSGVFSSNDVRHQSKNKSLQHQILMDQQLQQPQQQQIYYNSSKSLKNGNKRLDFAQFKTNK